MFFSPAEFLKADILSPFYSAPSIFALFRNLVQEKWFCKLGFFFWFEKSDGQKQRCGYTINPPFSGWRKVVLQTQIFFLVREKWLTRKKIRV